MLLKGIAHWAKVIGEPRTNDFDKDKRQWSIDVSVDKAGKEQLVKDGLAAKIRNVGDARGDFITFKRNEFKKDGLTRNQAIKIVDHHGQPWKAGVLIGNGSTVNVQYNTYDGFRGQKGAAILAIQVWDLVPFEGKSKGQDDFPIKTTDEGEVV